MKRMLFVTLAASSLAVALGCGPAQQDKNTLPSSAGNPAYAMSQPAAMEATAARLDAELAQAQQMTELLKTFPDALANPDWNFVEAIYVEADKSARTEAVAERFSEHQLLNEYLAEASAEQSKRAARSVENALKKEGVVSESNVRPGIKTALEDANKESLRDRLANSLESIKQLEMERESLGKENAKALEEQVLMVSWLSWWLGVESAKLGQKLERQLAESEAVRKTLEKAIEERQRRVDDPATSKTGKKESETQLAALRTARDGAEQKAKLVKDGMEQRKKTLQTARDQYKKAFEQLIDAVEKLQP